MILPFGKHKGKDLELIPEDYLMWLAKPKYGDGFYKNKHTTEKTWKVPMIITIEARKILEARGYRLIGERWEK